MIESGLFDLLSVLSFYDLQHVEAAESGITVFPLDSRPNRSYLFRDFFGEF
jgi:hypothetical protein